MSRDKTAGSMHAKRQSLPKLGTSDLGSALILPSGSYTCIYSVGSETCTSRYDLEFTSDGRVAGKVRAETSDSLHTITGVYNLQAMAVAWHEDFGDYHVEVEAKFERLDKKERVKLRGTYASDDGYVGELTLESDATVC